MRFARRTGLLALGVIVLTGFEAALLIDRAHAEFSAVLVAGHPHTTRVRVLASGFDDEAPHSVILTATADEPSVVIDVVQLQERCEDLTRCSVDYDVVLTSSDDVEVSVALEATVGTQANGCGGGHAPEAGIQIPACQHECDTAPLQAY